MTPRALLLLGYSFWRTLLLRWLRPREGLAQFHRNYAADRLPPVSSEERERLKAFSQCLGCGMCDAAFAAWPKVDRSAFHGPMDLPLAYSRSIPDYDTLRGYLAQLEKDDLSRLERLCPTGIPFRDLAAFARSKAAEAEALGAPSAELGDGLQDGLARLPRQVDPG